MAGEPIRVLIVEDHATFAKALQLLLSRRDRIEIVGVVGDGSGAVDLALEREVVLMDLTLPRIDGLEATRRLLAVRPQARVIVLTSQTADEGRQAALAAGAVEFITKSDAYERVPEAILRAAAGAGGEGTPPAPSPTAAPH